MNTKYTYPGDVVLFHRPTFNFFTALIHIATRSRWNHAAIVVDNTNGKVTIAEATAKGVVLSDLASTQDQIRMIPVAFDDEDDRWDAVAWAQARTGVRYGYLNAFMCGVNNILVGIGRGKLVIKMTDSIICSELVAEALSMGGHDFGKDHSQVSPGDLADYFGVQRK